MPALSMFFGIIVRMQSGSFPNKQLKLLLAWIAIHEDELNANWALLSNGEGYFKIEPLH